MQGAGTAVPMLLALTAAQFLVHAVGWTMAAFLFRRPSGPEGHFALFWSKMALALAVYVGFDSGHPLRTFADGLVLAALLVVHRGMLLHYRAALPDRFYAAAALALAAVLVASHGLPDGQRWRIAAVSLTTAAGLAAGVWVLWRHGRAQTPRLVLALVAPFGLMSVVMVARAAAVLASDEPRQFAVDAANARAAAFVVAILFVAGLFNLVQIRLVLGRVLERLLAQSRLDELTGVANRRGALLALRAAYERAHGASGANSAIATFGVLMVDVDHFKRVNDRWGHAAGDQALARVAKRLADGVRIGDLVARWGGEEFCVLLPRCEASGAHQLAERLRAAVAASGEPPLSVSIGIAIIDAAHETLDQGLARADAALYRAKEAGRNRVELAPPGAGSPRTASEPNA